jgi:hypothetical protein
VSKIRIEFLFLSGIVAISTFLLGRSNILLAASAPSENALPSATPHNEEGEFQDYPKWSNLFIDWVENYQEFGGNLTRYSPSTYGIVAGSTLALLPFDQKIYDSTRSFSRRNHIAKDESQERKAFGFNILGTEQSVFQPRTPLGVIWYYGDGSTLLATIGGFTAYGYANHNYKAVHVAYQLIEAGAIIGPTVQALKLMTGRESPAESSAAGGKWRGFPGFRAYSENQAKYYAFPSGHVSGAMTAGMVIIENYADAEWLIPAHSALIGALMFALMDVKAHWPSDYPLAVFLGYTAAKTAVQHHRKRFQTVQTESSAWQSVLPFASSQGLGLSASWQF